MCVGTAVSMLCAHRPVGMGVAAGPRQEAPAQHRCQPWCGGRRRCVLQVRLRPSVKGEHFRYREESLWPLFLVEGICVLRQEMCRPLCVDTWLQEGSCRLRRCRGYSTYWP